jgi:radical SAM protein with 4Fe4S-binding SPASM domain
MTILKENKDKVQIVKPRIIAFEVTQRCPLACRHCRASAAKDKSDVLTTEQCILILKSIADFNKCVIILTGGEPMERTDIYELIEHGQDLGLRMVMATCGYHITDTSAIRLKQVGITAISFSLDGATAETHDAFRKREGAFETVLGAIEKVRAAGIRFQINTTFTNQNIAEAAAIAALAEKLGAYCFNPFILVPVGRGEDIRDLILSAAEYEGLLTELAQLKQQSTIEVRVTCGPQFARICRYEKIEGADQVTGCLAATDFAFIGARGDVQTCGFLEISAGNLVENHFDFADIWLNSKLLNDLRDISKYKGACSGCGYASVCRGCRARAYTMLKDYLQHDPICRLTVNADRRQKSDNSTK